MPAEDAPSLMKPDVLATPWPVSVSDANEVLTDTSVAFVVGLSVTVKPLAKLRNDRCDMSVDAHLIAWPNSPDRYPRTSLTREP